MKDYKQYAKIIIRPFFYFKTLNLLQHFESLKNGDHPPYHGEHIVPHEFYSETTYELILPYKLFEEFIERIKNEVVETHVAFQSTYYYCVQLDVFEILISDDKTFVSSSFGFEINTQSFTITYNAFLLLLEDVVKVFNSSYSTDDYIFHLSFR